MGAREEYAMLQKQIQTLYEKMFSVRHPQTLGGFITHNQDIVTGPFLEWFSKLNHLDEITASEILDRFQRDYNGVSFKIEMYIQQDSHETHSREELETYLARLGDIWNDESYQQYIFKYPTYDGFRKAIKQAGII